MSISEIMEKYTVGEISTEEANAKLAEAQAGFRLEPGKNVLTEEELRATTIGHFPDQANGFGLLDTGTGTMDKVHVVNGKLDFPVNEVGEDGKPNMLAYCIIAGRTYQVKGAELVNPELQEEVPIIPKQPDMSRRKDLAGQVVQQTTKIGRYDVTYDENGYAVRAKRV